MNGPTFNEFLYNWPYEGNFSVTLTITDSLSNTDSETKHYNNEIPLGPGGGGPPSYNVAGQKEEQVPDVRVIKVYFKDIGKKDEIKIKIYGGVKFD